MFFPPGILEPRRQRDDAFLREWYESHLSAMGEPSLYGARETSVESYRFLWLRTFDEPVAVRVEKRPDEEPILTVKVLNGSGGFDPGLLQHRDERPLSAAAWDETVAAIEAAGFWEMPSRESESGLDGSRWVLEGIRDGAYHTAHRWSPEESDEKAAFRDACRALLALAEADLKGFFD